MLAVLTLSFQKIFWRWARGWEESQPGQLPQTGQNAILYYIASCSAIKSGVVEEEREFSSSRVAIAWRLAGHCLWQLVSHCFCITFISFPLHLFILSWLKSLIAFAFPVLSSVPLGVGTGKAAVWVLGCWLGSNLHPLPPHACRVGRGSPAPVVPTDLLLLCRAFYCCRHRQNLMSQAEFGSLNWRFISEWHE